LDSRPCACRLFDAPRDFAARGVQHLRDVRALCAEKRGEWLVTFDEVNFAWNQDHHAQPRIDGKPFDELVDQLGGSL
jgi:hypothetical protein